MGIAAGPGRGVELQQVSSISRPNTVFLELSGLPRMQPAPT